MEYAATFSESHTWRVRVLRGECDTSPRLQEILARLEAQAKAEAQKKGPDNAG